ncbi:hypothetical protein M6B38_337030 [Iris pallida]|uniref:Uncharacterized protein n=1 Tax=Iris pallida TaxID=29817 RepID=A0AAX6GZK3_IRIPA|nr:hypothetical protein M6B38_337030 [Iris pallida]
MNKKKRKSSRSMRGLLWPTDLWRGTRRRGGGSRSGLSDGRVGEVAVEASSLAVEPSRGGRSGMSLDGAAASVRRPGRGVVKVRRQRRLHEWHGARRVGAGVEARSVFEECTSFEMAIEAQI